MPFLDNRALKRRASTANGLAKCYQVRPMQEVQDQNSGSSDAKGGSILFVDLDGTLTATDLLWEAFFGALRQHPSLLLLAPFWLLRGRAAFKMLVSARHQPKAELLPYRNEVVEFLRSRKASGTRLVLATASTRHWAESVAQHLGLFDDILSSDAECNLKGRNKLLAIEAYCEKRGIQSWGYVGDCGADIPIWERAAEVDVVAPSSRTLSRVRAKAEPTMVFGKQTSRLSAIAKSMRPHQWVKNALLFVPLLLAREYTDLSKTLTTAAAFMAFSFCASAVYVLNDLLDVEADRMHPRKRRRPLASGALPLIWAPPLAIVLLAIAFGAASLMLDRSFVVVLALYLLVTTAYSVTLKRLLLVDVVILSGLYTLRIFAGAVAAKVTVSEWLLAFSIFLFTSLAFAKRHMEMARLEAEGKERAAGRGYRVEDISLLESFGATSGYLAVLVFALYVHDGLPAFYTHRWLLWLTCPLLLFWISRLWFLAKRGEMHDDPVVFALTDATSLAVGGAVVLMMLFAAPIW